MAGAGTADLDDNLPGAWLGLGQVHQFRVGLEALQLQCAHESSSGRMPALRRWCGQASKDSGFARRDTTERR